MMKKTKYICLPHKKACVPKGRKIVVEISSNKHYFSLMNNRGLSFVEILMSVAIFSFVLAALLSSFSAGNLSWTKVDANVLTQSQARLVLSRLTQELREGDTPNIVQDANSVVLTFNRTIDGLLQVVTYSWRDTGANAFQILRQDLGGSNIIAQNISAFSLSQSGNSLTVNVTASKNSNQGGINTFSLQGKVTLR